MTSLPFHPCLHKGFKIFKLLSSSQSVVDCQDKILSISNSLRMGPDGAMREEKASNKGSLLFLLPSPPPSLLLTSLYRASVWSRMQDSTTMFIYCFYICSLPGDGSPCAPILRRPTIQSSFFFLLFPPLSLSFPANQPTSIKMWVGINATR